MKTSALLKDMAAKTAAAMLADGQTIRQIDATNFFVATTVPEGYSCWDSFDNSDSQTLYIVWEKEE